MGQVYQDGYITGEEATSHLNKCPRSSLRCEPSALQIEKRARLSYGLLLSRSARQKRLYTGAFDLTTAPPFDCSEPQRILNVTYDHLGVEHSRVGNPGEG